MDLARVPFAIWDPITDRDTIRQSPVRMTLHTAWANAPDIYGPNRGQGATYAHFYNPTSGELRQHQEANRMARADLYGNGSTVSVEHQDERRDMPFSDAQMEADARLFAALVTAPGSRVPNRIATVNDTRGLAWHRLGCRGNFGRFDPNDRTTWSAAQTGERWSDVTGKTCPTNPRIRQVEEIWRRAQKYINGTVPIGSGVASGPASPTARADWEVQLFLAVLGLYDSGPGLKHVDGINGPNQKAAVTAYQRARGLTPDGWWGPNTDTHFGRHDMSKVLNDIARAVASFDNSGKDKASLWTRLKAIPGEVRDSDSLHAGKIHEAVQRDLNRLVVPLLENLTKAVANVSGGEAFDEAKLLAGVKASAEEGAREGTLAAEATLREALVSVLGEYLDDRDDQDTEELAAAVVRKLGARLSANQED